MRNSSARGYRRAIVGFVLLVAAVSTSGAKAEFQSTTPDGLHWTQGHPWTGPMGITETVATIMARPRQTKPLIARDERDHSPDRTHLPQNPKSPAVSQWPAAQPKAPGRRPAAGGPGVASPQTPGINCKGPTFDEIQAWPPDTMGDAGPTQYVVQVNGIVRSYNKFTCQADGALNTDENSFWASVAGGTGQTTDPRIRFDEATHRWFLVMIDVPALVEPTPPNSIMIAVSSGPVITSQSSFTFFAFKQSLVLPPGTDAQCFADYETLGIDKHALYIGTNMFCPVLFTNTSVFVVQKSSILGAGPLVVTAFRDLLDAPTIGAGPYTPQGVDNPDPNATTGYIVGNDNATFGTLVFAKISDPGGTPSISSNIFVTVPTTTFPTDPPNKGGDNALDSLDDRLHMAQLRGNHLWTAHAITVDSSGVGVSGGGRTGSRWYDFDMTPATPALNQMGTLFDPAASQPKSYWMPSVNVSGQGHMALGTSISSANDFVGASVAGRLASDPLGFIGAPVTYQPGLAPYNATNAGTAVTRWGDYSYTSVDPDDDMTMWTIQEYVDATDSYSERIVKLIAPPPATPSGASPSSVPINNPSINVTITGTSIDGSGFFDPGASFPKRLGVAISGGVTVNSVSYVDPTKIDLNISTVGAGIGVKTVTVTNPDGQSASASILGVGTGAGPAAGLNPTSVDFGNQLVGSTSPPQTVTVTSAGTASLVVGSISTIGSTAFAISADGCSGQTLPVGVSCTIDVTFSPATSGAEAGSLSIPSNSPSSPDLVALSGIGTTPDVTAPSKVLGLAGVAGSESATLSWTAATDDVGVDHYIVFEDGVDVLHVPSTIATINGLTNDVTYTFRVQAVDAAGNVGLLSDAVTVKPFGMWPQFHGNPSRTGQSTSKGSIAVPHLLQTLTATGTINSSPLIADLDADGKADVVTVGDVSTLGDLMDVRAFRQTPSGLAPMWSYTIPTDVTGGTPTNGICSLAIGDVTGDGIPDVVAYSNYKQDVGAGSLNDGHLTILNGRTGAFEAQLTSTDLTIGLASPPAIGDVTGDGTPDIVLLHQIGGAPPGGGYFLLGVYFDAGVLTKAFDTNLGTPAFLASPVLAELRSVHPGLEIVVGGHTATGQVLICRPIGSSAGCMEAVNAGMAIRGLAVADLDGDGIPEIVANGETAPSLKVMRTLPTFAMLDTSADGAIWNTPTLGDVTGDGHADIINVQNSFDQTDTSMQGDVLLRSLSGGAITGKKTLARPPSGIDSTMSPGGGVLVDIAGTSTPEFVLGSRDGTLVAVKFTAGTPSILWTMDTAANPVSPLAVGDVTGDGLADLVAGTDAGTLVVIGAGSLDHIALTPASSTITADQSQTYTVEGFDSSGNSLGDYSSQATLTIAPNGSCTGMTCSATTAGSHTVTGHVGPKTGTASLTITAGPVSTIVLAPSSATITAGGSQTYTAQGYDAFGNPIGDVTAQTTFGIGPDGTCTANACGSTVAGSHIVTGSIGAVMGTAALNVNPGPMASIVISPADATIALGGSKTYTAAGFDAFGNSVGDVTATTTFTITPDGTCTGNVCTPSALGDHNVIGSNSGFTASAILHVIPVYARIELSPSTATVPAGVAQSYTVEAFDSNDNSLGDVTAQTVFTIAPNGSCSAASCSATVAGSHVVTGTAAQASDTATLNVVVGPVASIAISPAQATIALGSSQTYTATGFDAFGNSAGDVTATTTFTITPDGTCSANVCTPSSVGDHNVIGNNSGFTASAILHVIPIAYARLELSPATATVTAGAVQAYTAEAFDSNDNSLGDVTSQTVFTIAPNGSCSLANCSATAAGPHVVKGVVASVSDTATLTVVAGPLDHLSLVPATSTVTVGTGRYYQANGLDAFGNPTGDVTASTIFTIAPEGTCAANKCTPSQVGSHTVTGVNGTATGTAQLKAIPVAPVIVYPDGGFQPATVNVSGTGSPGGSIALYEGPVQLVSGIAVDANGNWTVAQPFASGLHTIYARVTVGTFTSDPSATKSFTVDADPPIVAIHFPANYLLAAVFGPIDEVEVSGTAKDAISGVDHVTITYTDMILGTAVVDTIACSAPCPKMSWVDHPALPPGLYSVDVVATDRAGNFSATASMNIVNLSLVSGAARVPHLSHQLAD